MAPKMPAPMMAPIDSITRSPAPRTRFSDWLDSASSMSAMGFRVKSPGIVCRLRVGPALSRVEPVRRVIGRHDTRAVGTEGHADQAAAADHQLRLRAQVGETIHPA